MWYLVVVTRWDDERKEFVKHAVGQFRSLKTAKAFKNLSSDSAEIVEYNL